MKRRLKIFSVCSTISYTQGGKPMSFSIRLSKQEKMLAESYAKLHSISLGEAFKKDLFENFEDEYYLKVYEESYTEYVQNGRKSRPISELWEELGI